MADDPRTLAILKFKTYEDYLDSHVTDLDKFYLEDEEVARQLVEMGFRGNGEVMKREEFERRKREYEEQKSAQLSKSGIRLAGDLSRDYGSKLLRAIAEREEAILNHQLNTILYIRDYNAKRQEVSAYIDLGHRLQKEDFSAYFTKERRLLPQPSDLSFYNWDTNAAYSTPSPSYKIQNSLTGLKFKNIADRKVVDVDPEAVSPGDDVTRIVLECDDYEQVVIYDQILRS